MRVTRPLLNNNGRMLDSGVGRVRVESDREIAQDMSLVTANYGAKPVDFVVHNGRGVARCSQIAPGLISEEKDAGVSRRGETEVRIDLEIKNRVGTDPHIGGSAVIRCP